MPNTSAIINSNPADRINPQHNEMPAPILTPDFAKLIQKCLLDFDSLGCIIYNPPYLVLTFPLLPF